MRETLTYIVLVALSCIVGILISEIILRVISPGHTSEHTGAYIYDEKLGARLKPNIHFLKTTDYQQEVFTNKIGTVNFQDSFDGYEDLIFVIGDSYTQGTGLPGDASYPFQLNINLNTRDGEYTKKYAVVNLGLAASGGKQALLLLQMYKEIIGKPDYILYMGSNDDYTDDVVFTKGFRHNELVDGSPRWGVLLGPIQWFSNETAVGKRLMTSIRSHLKRNYINDDAYYQKQRSEDEKSTAQLQGPILDELLTVSKELGARLVVSWSDMPRANFKVSRKQRMKSYSSSYKRFKQMRKRARPSSYNWLKQWAENNGVAFADWHPGVESVQKAIPAIPSRNNHSGRHFRTWVNTIIAGAFAEQIRN